jgi:ribosomal protein L7/L12
LDSLVLIAVAAVAGIIGFLIGRATKNSSARSTESLEARAERKTEQRENVQSSDLKHEIQEHIAQGSSKIDAIKEVRERTGMGLADAKSYVESLDKLDSPVSSVPANHGSGKITELADLGRVKELLKNGRKIEALKAYRELSGLGLKEAKDELDRIERAIRLDRN